VKHRRFPDRRALLALAVVAAACAARRPATARHDSVQLNGERVGVEWIDGDTFRVAQGAFRGIKARLADVDALEMNRDYRWGESAGPFGATIACEATHLASAQAWECTSTGRSDTYGRLIVSCAGLEEALVVRGLALAAAYHGRAREAERYLPAQERAKAGRAGMWAMGLPSRVAIRASAAGEDGDGEVTAIDTRTGKIEHAAARGDATWYCVGQGRDAACVTADGRSERSSRCPARR
jgi:endonuclease YncB( thermonuclease family)